MGSSFSKAACQRTKRHRRISLAQCRPLNGASAYVSIRRRQESNERRCRRRKCCKRATGHILTAPLLDPSSSDVAVSYMTHSCHYVKGDEKKGTGRVLPDNDLHLAPNRHNKPSFAAAFGLSGKSRRRVNMSRVPRSTASHLRNKKDPRPRAGKSEGACTSHLNGNAGICGGLRWR